MVITPLPPTHTYHILYLVNFISVCWVNNNENLKLILCSDLTVTKSYSTFSEKRQSSWETYIYIYIYINRHDTFLYVSYSAVWHCSTCTCSCAGNLFTHCSLPFEDNLITDTWHKKSHVGTITQKQESIWQCKTKNVNAYFRYTH